MYFYGFTMMIGLYVDSCFVFDYIVTSNHVTWLLKDAFNHSIPGGVSSFLLCSAVSRVRGTDPRSISSLTLLLCACVCVCMCVCTRCCGPRQIGRQV